MWAWCMCKQASVLPWLGSGRSRQHRVDSTGLAPRCNRCRLAVRGATCRGGRGLCVLSITILQRRWFAPWRAIVRGAVSTRMGRSWVSGVKVARSRLGPGLRPLCARCRRRASRFPVPGAMICLCAVRGVERPSRSIRPMAPRQRLVPLMRIALPSSGATMWVSRVLVAVGAALALGWIRTVVPSKQTCLA